MKTLTRTSILIIIMGLAYSCSVSKKATKKANTDTENWRYEIQCEGTGSQGTYLIKVWSYSKLPKVAIKQSKKNAIHAIIFQGYTGGKRGCTSQKPLANNPNVKQEHEAFFKTFFADGGGFMKFVSSTTDGNVASGDVLKVNDDEYKIGIIVSVRKDALRKYLENAGIIKGLDSGF
ncbi:MAG: hypothetical protein PF487_09130 [Bacteroidales bacterium]|jgi:hypothetical protein|nr:hypothetical protein [Bacteroidales bacterium]